jgi:hypothetical protein
MRWPLLALLVACGSSASQYEISAKKLVTRARTTSVFGPANADEPSAAGDTAGNALRPRVTREQRANAKQLALRCFGTPEQMEGLTLFFPAERDRPQAQRSGARPERPHVRAHRAVMDRRVEVAGRNPRLASEVGHRDHHASAGEAGILTAGLESNVQVLTARGWK